MTSPLLSYVRADVPQQLRGYVTAVVAYDVEVGAPGSHVGMPSTALTLQLASGRPLRAGWAADEDADPVGVPALWGMLSGLHDRPARIVHDGRMTGVEVSLTPLGVRAVLGTCASDLAGHIVALGEVDRSLEALVEQVALSTTPRQRIEHTVRGLLAVARPDATEPTRPEVGFALARLTRGARVDDVAAETGLSRRHLTTLVKAETGLAPKTYHRVARLQRSCSDLKRSARHGRPSLAAVAVRAGYTDQAHMTRDWTELAGVTPSRWLRHEFPFVQDGAGA
ncbi:helix-turn-helix transcriptional regulator [Promicromonospora sp. NPDC050249]|uniref:helix-turn-helix domain-containing protein n=1 Tax=Promicromonospora sp. NPDC050249 TaxID=3154743 RepID=UPI0033FE5E34